MKQKKVFRRKCPTCQAKDKVLIACRNCYKYICRECALNQLCKDCYLILKDKQEVKRYFDEKYLCGVLVK